jgi:heterotetrameric sarcosine oxidase gamma subunit
MSEKKKIRSMPSALQQAAFAEPEFNSDSLALRELTGFTIIRAHSYGDRKGTELSDKTGDASGADPGILCVRPGEWLFISESNGVQDLRKRAHAEIQDQKCIVDNMSDAFAVFRLDGNGSPWLLSKLSGLDFLAGRSTGQHCARTKMGQVAVVIHYHQADHGAFVFDLLVDRSYAKYLWELLTASAPHADELALTFGAAA